MDNIILTHKLSRFFDTTRAVSDLTIAVPAGIIYGFLGPNGSGKTTTIRLLLGLLAPTSGKAEVFGFDPFTRGDQVRLRTGALLENSGLYERMTAEDNLDFYGQVWRIPVHKRRERIRDLLTDLDLWERRKEACGSWSRGMKQKLAIARALLHRPMLVFLDEPTASLDAVAAAALHQDLLNLTQRQGVTVFLTTHNLTEAEKLCAQVAVIRQGKLVSEGSPDELRLSRGQNRLEVFGRGYTQELLDMLYHRPEVSKLELDGTRLTLDLNENPDTAALVALLVAGGVKVDEVRKGKASLEEAFLELVKS
jgi:ABC-2 type transport system ATP-binding protein